MKSAYVKGVAAAFAIAAFGMTGIAVAQSEPTGVTKTRQDAMKANGKEVKAIKDELDKSSPSLSVIKENIAKLKDAAPKIVEWFPAGTGPESGMKTKALPAIWQKPDDFKKANQTYTGEVMKFAALTDKGDFAAMKSGLPAVQKSCGGCHNTFRLKDD